MWSLAGSQAVDQRIQPLWAGEAWAGWAALGLSHAALGSAVLGLWVEQLASAPDALGGFRCGRPSGVSCVCLQFAKCVRATGPQVSAGAPVLLIPRSKSRG